MYILQNEIREGAGRYILQNRVFTEAGVILGKSRLLLIPFGEKMDQLEVYTSLLFDVELFDDMVEEAIEEAPAQRDCSSLLYRNIGTRFG